MMRLKNLEINGFKSFAKKTNLEFQSPVVCVVGPNGSGKSNVVEAIRFVLGEQSMKSMRGKAGTDLVFKGSKTLSKSSRASVTIYFDNKDKIFKFPNESGDVVDLNYDVVSISREVYSDGVNKYMLNGTEVRLKDINNLLASVSIGSSGHHIISQGEADRILNAGSKERREMIEDALGLKIYQYKIKEADRKLTRTSENMKEVSLLRREIVPHLNFLKKQVEKFEKAKEMKVDLLSLYHEYLKKESVYLENENKNLSVEKTRIASEINNIAELIGEGNDDAPERENKDKEDLRNLEEKVSGIRMARGEVDRKLGRIEGMIEMEESRSNQKTEEVILSDSVSVPREEVESFLREAHEYLEEAMYMDVLENIAPLLGKIKDILDRFSRNFQHEKASSVPTPTFNNSNLEDLKKTQHEILTHLKEIEDEERKISETINILKNKISEELAKDRDKEREKFNLKVKHQELTSHLQIISVREENLVRENEAFRNEIEEGSALVGSEILFYKNFSTEGGSASGGEILINRTEQQELKRKIERIKIKLEDAGLGGGSEVLKEYQEVSDREQFLAREMEDLSVSIESLKKLMADLKEKIDLEFKHGIEKINVEFKEFFSLMFGGGTGSLNLISEIKKKAKFSEAESPEASEEAFREDDEDEVPEQGIEINVSLPHKKVKDLNALSGGERSLTSIALLFAMSQVNPPPFLVLDETDAALDEANSRKYGDMLEKLSKHSQLVVVTHNRETMSRAGVLYGVTVGADGASKLLSVKFDEATAIAK